MKGSKHAKIGNRKGHLGYRTPSRVKAGSNRPYVSRYAKGKTGRKTVSLDH